MSVGLLPGLYASTSCPFRFNPQGRFQSEPRRALGRKHSCSTAVLWILYKSPLERVRVHVSELLDLLLAAPDVEIIEPALPELWQTAVGSREQERSLRCRRTVVGLAPQLPRDTLLEHFENGRRSAASRLGNEQVDVLGHDHVTDQLEPKLFADLAENLDECIPSARRVEKRKSPVTTEGDEVQMAEPVDALEAFRHDSEAKSPTLTNRAWGTLNNVPSSEVPRWYHAPRYSGVECAETRKPGPPAL